MEIKKRKKGKEKEIANLLTIRFIRSMLYIVGSFSQCISIVWDLVGLVSLFGGVVCSLSFYMV